MDQSFLRQGLVRGLGHNHLSGGLYFHHLGQVRFPKPKLQSIIASGASEIKTLVRVCLALVTLTLRALLLDTTVGRGEVAGECLGCLRAQTRSSR